MPKPVFRFAPSPNGHLHLGHALSALLNADAARVMDGDLLLRIEDIDQARCTPALERDLLEDLTWLGVSFDGPVLRQSERFAIYQGALDRLTEMGLVYRGYLTRAEIKGFVSDFETGGDRWPRDPDGAPVYPGDHRVLAQPELEKRAAGDMPYALRLNMAAALDRIGTQLNWREAGAEGTALFEPARRIGADPAAWGDVVLARKDTPTSYHLSVVLDDAAQGVTDVLRGVDLRAATSVHRVLQALLDLPEPLYRHHRLVLGPDGRKLSKSNKDTSIRELRAQGISAAGIRTRVGL
ncbi:MAG: tRNA glutamyl-Q(34) synthetase GluQRS [Roseibium sp.]|nr:tRNA glutamyl-Q(34) synthetase GluQRS [Roseibium sp.]